MKKQNEQRPKLAPKLRFKGFTNDWEQRELHELVNFSKGKGYSKKDIVESGTPFMRYGNLYTDFEIEITDIKENVEEKPKSVKSKGGEILVPSSGETPSEIARASTLLKKDVIIGGDINILTVKNNNVLPTFLALDLNTNRNSKELSKYAVGNSVVHLYNKDLHRLKIYLPDIETQKKIIRIWRTLDKLLTLHKRKIEVLKNQKEYFLRKIFANKSPFPLLRFKGYLTEWEKLKIKNIGKVVTGNTPPTSDLENYSDKGLTWITPGNINDDNQLINNYKKLSNKGLKKARIVPSGSVLVTCIASIGKNLLTTDSISFNQQINAIVPQKIHSEFIFYRMYEVSNYMKRIAPAATMQIISKSEFENIKSYFPNNPNEAVKVSAFVKEVDKMISLHKKKLNKLESLKKEYLNYLFI